MVAPSGSTLKGEMPPTEKLGSGLLNGAAPIGASATPK